MFVKISNIKSHKNPSIWTRTVPWRLTDGRKGTAGLTVSLLSYFENDPITAWKKNLMKYRSKFIRNSEGSVSAE